MSPPPHPRETFDFLTGEGGEGAEGAFLGALEKGRLHHAWLVSGPPGVGKASFAYRAARRLLGAIPAPALGALGADPSDPVCRQILGRAHPDLLVLQRDPEDGKARKGIPVEEARALAEFFSKSPAAAPYRVAIIDTADDLAPAAANAVLKTLEEPPPRGVLFLLSDNPGALLPTLRSRCRRLRRAPPAAELVRPWLEARTDLGPGEAEQLLTMARGAPGRAWRLAAAGALEADETARALLLGGEALGEGPLIALAEGFRGAAGAERFDLLFDRLAARLHAQLAGAALSGEGGGPRSERLAEVWGLLASLPARAAAVNLDRGDVFFTAMARLKAAL